MLREGAKERCRDRLKIRPRKRTKGEDYDKREGQQERTRVELKGKDW